MCWNKWCTCGLHGSYSGLLDHPNDSSQCVIVFLHAGGTATREARRGRTRGEVIPFRPWNGEEFSAQATYNIKEGYFTIYYYVWKNYTSSKFFLCNEQSLVSTLYYRWSTCMLCCTCIFRCDIIILYVYCIVSVMHNADVLVSCPAPSLR